MRIIDLLNKIANGEEVPNFIVDEVEYYMGANGYLRECMGDDTQWYIDESWLNTKVQIIEEKKIPEKSNIDFNTKLPVSGCSENEAFMMTCISHLGKTIDSLIDYLKSKGDE